ncbi:MAG: hypothetical protein AAGA54_22655 [Myxococcota bacterium]
MRSRGWAFCAALAALPGCFPQYGSGPGGDSERDTRVALPDGPVPCGDSECTVDQVCIQPGQQWGEGCVLEDLPEPFCGARLEACDDEPADQYIGCLGAGWCGSGGCGGPELAGHTLVCNDTPCHCPDE